MSCCSVGPNLIELNLCSVTLNLAISIYLSVQLSCLVMSSWRSDPANRIRSGLSGNSYKLGIEVSASHNLLLHLLGRPTLVGKALSFTHELFSFFYQSTVLSSHTEDGHQMYFFMYFNVFFIVLCFIAFLVLCFN